MAMIEWKEEFKTGLSGVDYEHEELIKQINEIFNIANKAQEKEQIKAVMGELYGSISGHFVLEENMMEKYKYDQFEAHRNDHNKLLDEINELTDSFVKTGGISEAELEQRLASWFVDHFKTHDARLHQLEALMIEHEVNNSKFGKKLLGTMKNLVGKK